MSGSARWDVDRVVVSDFDNLARTRGGLVEDVLPSAADEQIEAASGVKRIGARATEELVLSVTVALKEVASRAAPGDCVQRSRVSNVWELPTPLPS